MHAHSKSLKNVLPFCLRLALFHCTKRKRISRVLNFSINLINYTGDSNTKFDVMHFVQWYPVTAIANFHHSVLSERTTPIQSAVPLSKVDCKALQLSTKRLPEKEKTVKNKGYWDTIGTIETFSEIGQMRFLWFVFRTSLIQPCLRGTKVVNC